MNDLMSKLADVITGGIITGGFIYCVWLFFEAVDAYLSSQMNLWNENLGM